MSDVDYRDDDQTDPGGTSDAPPRTPSGPSPDEQIQQRWPTTTWSPQARSDLQGLAQQAQPPLTPTQPSTPQQPQRVGPDQSVQPGSYTSGLPTPQAPLRPPAAPFGPFGLPPFQRAPRQHFIPSMPNRGPRAWGMPRRFPMLPRMWELPGIYNGIGRQLAQWGSAGVAPFAAQLGQHSGAWMKGYMQGQEALARLQHQKMALASQQLEQNLQNELREYGSIFAIFGDDPKNQGRLEQALRNAAQKFGDQHMIEALNTTGIQGAHNLINWLDAKHSDLRVSNAQRRKDEQIREFENPYRISPSTPAGLPDTEAPRSELDPIRPEPEPPPSTPQNPDGTPGETGGADPDGGTSPDPPTLQLGAAEPTEPEQQVAQADQQQDTAPVGFEPLTDQEDQAQPSDRQMGQARQQLAQGLRGQTAQQPTQLPGVQVTAGAPQRQPELPLPKSPSLDAARQAGFDPRWINQFAQQMLLGTWKDSQGKNIPNVANWARRRYVEMQGQLDNVLRDQNLKGDDVIDAVRRISPTLGEDINALKEGAVAPPRGQSLSKAPWDRIYALTLKADPTMTEAAFRTRAKTMMDFTSGYDGRNVTAIATAYRHLGAAIDAVRDMPNYWERQMMRTGPTEQALEMIDPEAARRMGQLTNRINTAMAEYERALTGGKPTVTGRREQMDEADVLRLGPQAVTANLQDKIDRLAERMDENRRRFIAGTNLNDPNAMLKLFDPDTRDTIQELQKVGRPVGRAPTPHPQDNEALDWARSHPNDPRSKQILELNR